MQENDDHKTIRTDKFILESKKKNKVGYSSTLEISRKTFIGKIPIKQNAFLEILDENHVQIELGKDEVIIGRVPDCDLQLLVENVSRKHARILYANEEYQIEDLNSTNGVYVNGIKVEKIARARMHSMMSAIFILILSPLE